MKVKTNKTLVEEEKGDPQHTREERILREDYKFDTQTNMPRHSCFDIPVHPSFFEENAKLGYCTIHRHPLYVEFIETLSSLLIKELQKVYSAADFAAIATITEGQMGVLREQAQHKCLPSFLYDFHEHYNENA